MCFCHCAEEDANELDRLRRLLCIPRADVDKVNKEICGRIYQEVSPCPLLTSLTPPWQAEWPEILPGSPADLCMAVCV